MIFSKNSLLGGSRSSQLVSWVHNTHGSLRKWSNLFPKPLWSPLLRLLAEEMIPEPDRDRGRSRERVAMSTNAAKGEKNPQDPDPPSSPQGSSSESSESSEGLDKKEDC